MKPLMTVSLLLACAMLACGQPEPPAQPPVTPAVHPDPVVHQHIPIDILNVLKIDKSAPAAYLLASVADSTTDWQFTRRGREYNITPKQQVALAGGVVAVGLLIRHLKPAWARYVDVSFTVLAGIRGYRAYANAQR